MTEAKYVKMSEEEKRNFWDRYDTDIQVILVVIVAVLLKVFF